MIFLTDNSFDGYVSADALVVVVFSATWCSPCKVYAHVFENVAKDFEGSVSMYKADVDACPKSSAKFGVSSVPTTMFFFSGKKIGSMSGAKKEEDLIKRIKEYMSEYSK